MLFMSNCIDLCKIYAELRELLSTHFIWCLSYEQRTHQFCKLNLPKATFPFDSNNSFDKEMENSFQLNKNCWIIPGKRDADCFNDGIYSTQIEKFGNLRKAFVM